MLEYVKVILQKVSFDRFLFEKELKKGLRLLQPKEVDSLREWCYQHFVKQYRTVLNSCFELSVS